MRIVCLVCVALSACGAPREAKTVSAPAPLPGLQRRLEIDTMRLARGAADGQWSVAGLVEKHLATVGLVRPGKTRDDTITLLADLPTPGYALRARVQPRPEQFCHLELEVISLPGERAVDAAPFWAVRALEESAGGIETLQPPRRRALDDARFARLHAQAARLAAQGRDPPITAEDYIHAARPLTGNVPEDYFAPMAPSAPSHLLPR